METGISRAQRNGSIRGERFRYAPARLQSLVNDGGIVTNLKHSPSKWLLMPYFLVVEIWSTWAAIRELKPDVIHAHWLIPQGLVIALLSTVNCNMPPVLVTSHGADLYVPQFCPMPALQRSMHYLIEKQLECVKLW